MSALLSLLKFRLLTDQLEDDELDSCLKTFIEKFGNECREMILTAIVNDVLVSKEDDSIMLDEMTEIPREIIRKRKKVRQTVQPGSIESLSMDIIGEVASYLELADHCSFSRCSLSMYIGSNSPNTLQHLNLNDINNYPDVDLERYPQIHTLNVKLADFDKLPFSRNGSVCPRLRRIIIGNVDGGPHVDIDAFLECSALPFEQITHLQLKWFSYYEDEDTFPAKKLLRLLSVFPNLECLTFHGVFAETFTDDQLESLRAILPHLTSFYCDDFTECSRQIIHLFGARLRGVTLNDPDDSIPKLLHLEEVGLALPMKHHVLRQITKSCQSLQRICITLEHSDDVDNEVHTHQMHELMTRVLTEQDDLGELMIIADAFQHADVCDALEQTLFIMEFAQGRRLQIKVQMCAYEGGKLPNFKDIMSQISKVTNQLFESDIQDYLFSWSLSLKARKKDIGYCGEVWKKAMDQFVSQNASKCDVSYSEKHIIISNKNCQLAACIQGYMWNEWLMHDLTRSD